MNAGIIYNKSAFKHGLTEEEADALDEELTQNTPRVDFNKPVIFIQQREFLKLLKPAAADYIMTRALTTHQTPVQIINELVAERITAATG